MVIDGRLATDDVAHDADVLARPGEWFRIGLAVPTLDDLWSRSTEAENETTVAEMVDGHRGHRGGGRCAGAHLDDAGAETDTLGVRSPPGEWCEGIAAVRLGGPHRVEAQTVGLLDSFECAGGWATAPVTGVVAELHVLLGGHSRDDTTVADVRSDRTPRATRSARRCPLSRSCSGRAPCGGGSACDGRATAGPLAIRHGRVQRRGSSGCPTRR